MIKKSLVFSLILLSNLGYNQSKVKNLELNTKYPHFGVSLFGANQILFTSYKLNKKGKVKQAFDGQGILMIYKGTITADGNIQNIEDIIIDPKSGLENITSATVSPNGNKIFITTTYTNKNRPKGSYNKANFHIEIGEYKAGIGFTNFKVLQFCKPKFSYAHPALSADGKTLYFTANFKGGRETTKGASDIFKVDVLDNTTFGDIKNLGSKVNSYSREMFPTVSADGTLYFASNRPNGLGGYDLYQSKIKEDGTYKKAEKLPKPINSKEDDLSLVMFTNNKTGFIVSKRKGGEGDDDIYYFTLN